MRWKHNTCRLIAIFGLAVLAMACGSDRKSTPADTGVNEPAPSESSGAASGVTKELGNGPAAGKKCKNKPTLTGTPASVDEDIPFKKPPNVASHLRMGQSIHVQGPLMDGTYELTPIESMPPHSWEKDVTLTATPTAVENEFCVVPDVTSGDPGHTKKPHYFLFRVLEEGYCIQKPKKDQCEDADNDDHGIMDDHGGSAHLRL